LSQRIIGSSPSARRKADKARMAGRLKRYSVRSRRQRRRSRFSIADPEKLIWVMRRPGDAKASGRSAMSLQVQHDPKNGAEITY
jgi:hypothetical protein